MTYKDQEAMENRSRFNDYLDERNCIDLNALQAGADKNIAEREAAQTEARERQLKAQLAREAAVGQLLQKVSESVKTDSKAAAEARIQEETERQAQQIRDKYTKEFNVQEETDIDKGLKNLLRNIRPQ